MSNRGCIAVFAVLLLAACSKEPGFRTLLDRTSRPHKVEGLEGPAEEIATGNNSTCAVIDGKVFCWGGDFKRLSRIEGLPEGVSSIVGGGKSYCVLHGGSVYCWGSNDYGQLGNPGQQLEKSEEKYRSSAFPVLNEAGEILKDVKKMVLSVKTGCAIQTNQNLFCWGSHHSFFPQKDRELAPKKYDRAVAISDFNEGVLDVAFGYGWCVISGRGGLVCESPVPKEFDKLGLRDLHSLHSAGNHFCVRTSVHEVCWGENSNSQLSDERTDLGGEEIFQERVFPFFGDALEVGARSTCSLSPEGQVWCRGDNQYGQLGQPLESDFRKTQYRSLGKVPDLERVVKVSLRTNHACAIEVDGDVKCWGDNRYGQLGGDVFE